MNMRQFEGLSRGKFIEKFFLGEISIKEYTKAMEKCSYKGSSGEYKLSDLDNFANYIKFLEDHYPSEDDMEILVKESQPWKNPRNPGQLMPKQLYEAVKEKVRDFAPKLMYSEIRYFTAANSHLDAKRVTDAFFEYYEDTGEEDLRQMAQVRFNIKSGNETGPKILNISAEDSEKVEELYNQNKMEELQRLVAPYLDKWSTQIAKLIEDERSVKIRKGKY